MVDRLSPPHVIRAIAALCLALLGAAGRGDAATGASLTIANRASATYSDAAGDSFVTQSNTVVATVQAVSALVVTPKENRCDPNVDAAATGTIVTKTFAVANASNGADAYTVQNVTTTAGRVASIAFATASGPVPVTIGTTVSPTIGPGATQAVLVRIDTASVAPGTQATVTLTARSTATGSANGLQSDTGLTCIVSAAGATLGGPGGQKTPILKTVNGASFVQSSAGASVAYAIAFENYGGIAVQNAVVNDPLPAGETPDSASVKFDGTPVASTNVSFAGQTLAVRIGSLAPATTHSLTFNAALPAGASLGASYVNVATVAGDNVAAARSVPAAVSVGIDNVVYDGYVGSSAPVAGATLTLIDAKTGQPVPLASANLAPAASLSKASSAAAGASALADASAKSGNPFVTGNDGRYGFAFDGAQMGTPSAPATYDVLVSAPGYLNRKIALTLTPDASDLFYTAALTSLDAQPLAVAGGFALTTKNVTLANVFGLFGNLPLFKAQTVTLTKIVDRATASGGDRLVWTLNVGNASSARLGATTVADDLPPGIVYAPGTGRVDAQPVEPAVTGRRLTWTFPSLAATAHTIVFASVISAGVAEQSTIVNVATANAALPGGTGGFTSASASASVRIVGGLFSSCTPILGRAYADRIGSGRFAPGDAGIANVRVFLENGESVVTDRYGRYSFPCTRPGMHVLRLDATTLPAGIAPYDARAYDDERSVRRLVHGIFDGTSIQDVNFALRETTP